MKTAPGWICLTQSASDLDPRRRIYLNVHTIAGFRGSGWGEIGGTKLWQTADNETLWAVEESPTRVFALIAAALQDEQAARMPRRDDAPPEHA